MEERLPILRLIDGGATDPAIEKRLLNIGAQVVRLASLQERIRRDS